MNKTKKYSVIPINNSTRKTKNSNSDTFLALQYPGYNRTIKEKKEKEKRELKKRSLRNLAVQLSKGDESAKTELDKLSSEDYNTLVKIVESNIVSPKLVIGKFESPFVNQEGSKGIKRSPTRRKLGGKRKNKKKKLTKKK